MLGKDSAPPKDGEQRLVRVLKELGSRGIIEGLTSPADPLAWVRRDDNSVQVPRIGLIAAAATRVDTGAPSPLALMTTTGHAPVLAWLQGLDAAEVASLPVHALVEVIIHSRESIFLHDNDGDNLTCVDLG